KLLPDLIIDGEGTTTLKNSLQLLALGISLLTAILIIVKSNANRTFPYMIVAASIYLMISDAMFMRYTSVTGVENFVGHLLHMSAFYYLLRAIYFHSVTEPFEKQKQAEAALAHRLYHDGLTGLPNSRNFK